MKLNWSVCRLPCGNPRLTIWDEEIPGTKVTVTFLDADSLEHFVNDIKAQADRIMASEPVNQFRKEFPDKW